jgi:hypothetical protein
MQARKAGSTRRTARQRLDADRILQATSQIHTLAVALQHVDEGLSWREAPGKQLVRALEDLVQIIVEKAAALQALIEQVGR